MVETDGTGEEVEDNEKVESEDKDEKESEINVNKESQKETLDKQENIITNSATNRKTSNRVAIASPTQPPPPTTTTTTATTIISTRTPTKNIVKKLENDVVDLTDDRCMYKLKFCLCVLKLKCLNYVFSFP